MVAYLIQFWRGQEQIIDYEDDEFPSPEAARQHINDLIQEMMSDAWAEDWTGCRFEVTTPDGERVFEVPVLTTMSTIARRKAH